MIEAMAEAICYGDLYEYPFSEWTRVEYRKTARAAYAAMRGAMQ